MNTRFYPAPTRMYPNWNWINTVAPRTSRMYQANYHSKKNPLPKLPGMNLCVTKLGGGLYAVELVYDWTFPRDPRVLTLSTGLTYPRAQRLKNRLMVELGGN